MAHFNTLPPELRLRIWGFVAPAVCPRRDAQVFELTLRIVTRPDNEALDSDDEELYGEETPYDGVPYYVALPGYRKNEMIMRTAGVRIMLSVHRESRAEALKYFPHALTIHDLTGAVIRFDRERDLVLLSAAPPFHALSTSPHQYYRHLDSMWFKQSRHYQIDNFTTSIRHLGFSNSLANLLRKGFEYQDDDIHFIWHIMMFLRPFTNLVAVYKLSDVKRLTNYELRWCASDKVNHWQTTDGFLSRVLCWPNLINNTYYAVTEDTLHDGERDLPTNIFEIMTYLLLRESHWSPTVKAQIRARIQGYLDEEDLWRLSSVELWKGSYLSVSRHRRLDPNCSSPSTTDSGKPSTEDSSGMNTMYRLRCIDM
ncbi:hypothetical protein GGR57DRAFT_61271 [Xylariaceae sp. FL1272]|nr:hypothetical protein GGR57DRAFT_61271 [Xylariaceae sp. FL1272]